MNAYGTTHAGWSHISASYCESATYRHSTAEITPSFAYFRPQFGNRRRAPMSRCNRYDHDTFPQQNQTLSLDPFLLPATLMKWVKRIEPPSTAKNIEKGEKPMKSTTPRFVSSPSSKPQHPPQTGNTELCLAPSYAWHRVMPITM